MDWVSRAGVLVLTTACRHVRRELLIFAVVMSVRVLQRTREILRVEHPGGPPTTAEALAQAIHEDPDCQIVQAVARTVSNTAQTALEMLPRVESAEPSPEELQSMALLNEAFAMALAHDPARS